MSSAEEILARIRPLRPVLAEEYNVKNLHVFGSIVRGEARPESDLDILVEFSKPVGFFKFLELEEFLSSKTGKHVDLVSKKALKPYIGRQILKETVEV